jgi:type-F conjugative transfer system pilin assembly protein TrbC
MAKNQLLCFLIILFFSAIIISNSGHILAQSFSNVNNALLKELDNLKPTNEQLNWAKNIKNQGQILTRNAILQKLDELDTVNQANKLVSEKIVNHRVLLKVLVSSLMPKNLLKTYHQQVVKFGGSLVFKGLPNGSFKELTKLVMAISENGEVGSMQIDDETFECFGINAVPAILLVKEEDCLEAQSCKVIYDKITGNIGIKAALEKFAINGDLSQEAQELLQR